MKKLPLFLFIGAIGFLIYALVYLDGGNIKIKTGKRSKTEKAEARKTKVAQRVDKIKKVHEFGKIHVDGVFKVVVTYGTEEKIQLETPGKSSEEVKLKVKSGTLMVKLDKSTALLYRPGSKIHIYTAKLNDFTLEGASSIQLNNTLKDDSFSIKTSGGASFTGDVEVATAEIEVEGASNVELSGTATTANLDLSGAGKLKDFDFKVNNLHVEMNGLSKANITCSKSIKGHLVGISKLIYAGKPSVKNLKTSGAAKHSKR
jgi:hypothetical protein